MPRTHEWNRGFVWPQPTGPFQVLSGAQAASFDRRGFVVLEDCFTAGQLDRLTAETDRFEQELEAELRLRPDQRDFIAEAGAVTFTPNLVARSPAVRSFALGEVLVGCAADLVGPDVDLHWDHAIYKKADKPREFPWHQDNAYGFMEPQHYLTCWVPLTEATRESGCLWFAPGYHRLGTLRHEYLDPLGWRCPIEDAGTPVPVSRGSCVLFSSLTPHFSGPNLTPATRKAWLVHFCTADSVVVEDGDGGLRRRPARGQDSGAQFAVLRGGRRCRQPASGTSDTGSRVRPMAQ